MHIISVLIMSKEVIMNAYRSLLIIAASSVVILSGCAVETVSYNPGYADVVYTQSTMYGTYPSYNWGYSGDYTPVYATGAYGGMGGFYGGFGGYRHGYGGYYRGGGFYHGGRFR
jgi:hypothetical protein